MKMELVREACLKEMPKLVRQQRTSAYLTINNVSSWRFKPFRPVPFWLLLCLSNNAFVVVVFVVAYISTEDVPFLHVNTGVALTVVRTGFQLLVIRLETPTFHPM